MKLALKRAWLKRLRTGRKATGVLMRKNGSKCCLGHLAKAGGCTPYVDCIYDKPRIMFENNNSAYMLDDSMLRRFGLTSSQQDDLTCLNDTTPGFGKVIEYIKKNVKVTRR